MESRSSLSVLGSPAAVIKMEGGTDFDLQVLEVPTAPLAAAGDASSAGGSGGSGEEKSQGGTEPAGSQTEEPKEPDKVRQPECDSFWCALIGQRST